MGAVSQHFNDELKSRLERFKVNDTFRRLNGTSPQGIDFSSNDYLGIAHSSEAYGLFQNIISKRKLSSLGSTGSRLISGDSEYADELEHMIANFHHAETGLLFHSGYDANVALMATLPHRHDTVLYDEYVHASIRDGLRMNPCRSFSFKHNDIESLKARMNEVRGTVYIVVESIYSMDGDVAPLKEMVEFCKQHNAILIVDEAHSNGLFGERGEGLVFKLALHKDVHVRLMTFGKALGVNGALVLGSNELKEYLINTARPFIYSTAPSPIFLAAIEAAYSYNAQCGASLREQFWKNVAHLSDELSSFNREDVLMGVAGIHGVICRDSQTCRKISSQLNEKGFFVKPVVSPTVPKGKERVRVCIHSYNSALEIETFVKEIRRSL